MRKYIKKEIKAYLSENSSTHTIKELSQMLNMEENSLRSYLNRNRLTYKKCYIRYRQSLSGREVEVMELLTNAYSINAVAMELCISRATAVSHINNVRNKLGVCSDGKHNVLLLTVNKYLDYKKGKANDKETN